VLKALVSSEQIRFKQPSETVQTDGRMKFGSQFQTVGPATEKGDGKVFMYGEREMYSLAHVPMITVFQQSFYSADKVTDFYINTLQQNRTVSHFINQVYMNKSYT